MVSLVASCGGITVVRFLYRDDLQETKIGIFSIKYEVKTNPSFFSTGYLSFNFFFEVSGPVLFSIFIHTLLKTERNKRCSNF